MQKRYRIQFPPAASHQMGQDEAHFNLIENGERVELRLHDYDVFEGVCSKGSVRRGLFEGVCSKMTWG